MGAGRRGRRGDQCRTRLVAGLVGQAVSGTSSGRPDGQRGAVGDPKFWLELEGRRGLLVRSPVGITVVIRHGVDVVREMVTQPGLGSVSV